MTAAFLDLSAGRPVKQAALLPDGGTASRSESTKYRGRHYVEAYIVKDGRVVASDRHDVEIR